MVSFDRTQSIEQLDGQVWPDQSDGYVSYLAERCHQLHKLPLQHCTVEDLRLLISQNIGLAYCIPLALEQLQADILVAGNYYPGDLLFAVLTSEQSFWLQHVVLWQQVVQLIQGHPYHLAKLKQGFSKELVKLFADRDTVFLTYHPLPVWHAEMLKYTIPLAQLRSVGPQIAQAYLSVLAALTHTQLLTDPEINIQYDQGEPMERIVQYGDQRLGLAMVGQPVQSGIGVHGETATWKFYGLPYGITLVGHSHIDYRALGEQYIWLECRTSDPALQEKTKLAFTQATTNYLA